MEILLKDTKHLVNKDLDTRTALVTLLILDQTARYLIVENLERVSARYR